METRKGLMGETFSLPVSKTKAAPPSPNLSSLRKGTPERRRTTTPLRGKADGADQLENSKPVDQHRWPGGLRQGIMARSLDCSNGDRNKVIGSGNVIRTLQQSMIDERRASFDGRLSLDLGNAEPLKAVEQAQDVNSTNNDSSLPSDLTASDTDSVSSGSTSGVQECGGVPDTRRVCGIVVSARFWQETNSRLRRLQDPGSPLSTSPGSKLVAPPKLRKYPSDVPISSPRAMSSPIRGGIRSASPSKLIGSSPSRGMPSPSRVRNVWRFVNATTEATLLVQKHSAEKTLWNAWITISDLRDTVTKKRHRLQLLRQKLKLASILKGQMSLEVWASFDKEHSISLLGAIEALKASTLRLPVVGANINIQNLKDAISSAHGVMQAVYNPGSVPFWARWRT
ncbi:hypothetical protein HAX54_038239 [Datura stramonium]|uniref:QWRF motif-containing protein 2 n=1 Tax=Datura stramonium TaxID=4076 RepID=A0ABS8SHW8_DATST|nr:hypothetical protein [Datura stramonium]